MRQLSIILVILMAVGSAQAQSKSAQNSRTPSQSHAATPPAKPKQPQPEFLSRSLDLDQTSVGPDFHGHDITVIMAAIKDSPALKEKSEFESTSAFETRRAGFVEKPLYGTVTPNAYLGFIVGEESIITPSFKYDADSQTLMVTLTAGTERFIMDKDKPTLDDVLIRRIVRDKDSYIGSNAFVAKVEIRRTYSEEYGVAFPEDSLLFRGTERYGRTFTYLLATSPDEARALKADAKLLLVCRLSQPWFRQSAHGHDATIDEPYETIIGDNYLQVEPEQLWIFHQQTGEVIRKLSSSSLASESGDQFKLKLRQTPVLLEVSPASISSMKIAIDDDPGSSDVISPGTKTFAAKHKIVLTLECPRSLSDISFKLNGKPYVPDWTKDATRIGGYESIHSATAVITAP